MACLEKSVAFLKMTVNNPNRFDGKKGEKMLIYIYKKRATQCHLEHNMGTEAK